MQRLKPFFLIVDIGFIVYWLVTALHLIPPAWAFKDYTHPILSAWNWSFLPLDLAISATGLASVWLWGRRDERWRNTAILSLTLTFCSGLMALSFWAIRGDFDVMWWAANGFLMIYPLFFLPRLVFGQRRPVSVL